MKASILSIATVAMLAPAWASAQISYSYVRGAYLLSETDTVLGEEDGAGPLLGVSYEVLDFLHVFGDYRLNELDDQPLETETFRLGFGFNVDFSDRQSVFFDFAAVRAETDIETMAGNLSGDEDGYAVSIGYRETNQTRLEFTVSVDYIEFEDIDYDDTSLSLSLQYEVTRRLKVEGGINFAGDDNYALIGLRYYLPGRAR